MVSKRNITQEYEIDKWQKVYEFVEQKSKLITEIDLYQLMYSMQTELRKNRQQVNFGRKNDSIVLPLDFVLAGNQSLISNYLSSCLSKEIRHIYELGSGFGRNLFWLWLSLQNRNVELVGCEITSSGRNASELIAGFDDKIRFKSQNFDFYKINEMVKDEEQSLVFTVHSIEQIPEVPDDIVFKLTEKFPNAVFVHFEPLGWQIAGHTGEESIHSSEWYAKENNYNRNFFATLLKAQEQKKIVIEEILRDEICVNSKNGTSIIRWRPVN